MNYRYILILLLFFIAHCVKAQQLLVPALRPGDTVPDILIPKLIHTNKSKVSIGDFSKQLLILDFWATSCSGCVEALPKMQSLQKQFGNSIKILPVTEEKEDLVINFWKNNKYTRVLSIPSIVEDKVLNKYFKHWVNPHEVWIYKGKVIGITDAEYVDSNNIARVLNGEKVSWPFKYDYYVYDPSHPLFSPDEKQIDTSSTIMKYAAMCGYLEKVQSEASAGGTGTIRNKDKKTIRTYFINRSIFEAYMLNWNKLIKLGDLVKPFPYEYLPNQIIWEVGDKSKYVYLPEYGYREDWLRLHGICFESQNLDTGQTDQQVTQSIVADMDALLGLRGRWEKRKEKVLCLIKKGQQSATKPTKGMDYSISSLIYELNLQEGNPYVFNESRSNEKLNLDVKSWTDIQSVREALQLCNYDLIEKEKEVDKFVFSETEGGLLVNALEVAKFKAKREKQKDLGPPPAEDNKIFLENNKKQPGIVKLPSGLQYKVIKQGNGKKPTVNANVRVNYTGMLVNGKIFESTDESGRPVNVTIKQMIQGWVEALPLMQEGSKWILYVPPELAYGTHTNQGALPPNSTLIFEIELLQILP